jgi:hypothetical protein
MKFDRISFNFSNKVLDIRIHVQQIMKIVFFEDV